MKTQVKVLLVEDDQFSQLVAEVALRNLGAMFRSVSSGEEAIDHLSTPEGCSYDFILMDFRMPGIDGFETTRRIRSHANPEIQKIPVIGLSGNKAFSDQREGLASGMNVCIGKPVSMAALKKAFFESGDRGNAECREVVDQSDQVLDVRTLNYLLEETNVSVVKKVVQSFLKNLPFYVDQISQGLAQEQFELIHRYSHILKASSGTVGATALFQLSSQLERLTSSSDHDELADLVSKVSENSGRVVVALTAYLDEIWAQSKDKKPPS